MFLAEKSIEFSILERLLLKILIGTKFDFSRLTGIIFLQVIEGRRQLGRRQKALLTPDDFGQSCLELWATETVESI